MVKHGLGLRLENRSLKGNTHRPRAARRISLPRGDASKIEQCPIGAAGRRVRRALMPPVWVTSLNIMGAAVSMRAVP